MDIVSVINQRESLHIRSEILLGMILVGSFLLRIWLVFASALPFNADEAVVALMGRHIRLGHGLPIFFYGQAYMGSMDAILTAIGFSLLGEHVWVIRLVQALLYTGILITSYMLAKNLTHSRSIGILAALLLMIPNVNVTLYTSVSLGGYGEALLIGNLILLQALSLRQAEAPGSKILSWFWLGGLIGFGFWVFGLTLIYSAAAVVYLVWKLFLKPGPDGQKMTTTVWIWFLLGTLLGLLPVILFGIQNGIGAVIAEFFGSAISGASAGTNFVRTWHNLTSLLLLGIPVILGVRPPWEVRWLILPLIPFVLFFWGVVIREFIRKQSAVRRAMLDSGLLIALVVLLNILGFLLTPFGSDPSGRYFLPLTLMLTIIGAIVIYHLSRRWRAWIWILPAFILGYHFACLIDSVYINPAGLTTQFDAVTRVHHEYDEELVQFLKSNGISSGYSNYWVAYPLAFLSSEELIFVPVLPYHQDFRYTTRDNRFDPYNQIVREAEDIAYITTMNEPLNQYLRQAFGEKYIVWDEAIIGDFHIFYNLSRKVTPIEIGLGVTR